MAKIIHRPRYKIINGIRFPEMFSSKCLHEALNYKPGKDDVFIMTYPRCGTTWMQNILLYIFRKGQELEDPKDIHRMCPFIDCEGLEGVKMMPRPGAFKTHLPYTHIPYSPEAKYIIVLRNPKDCCVSLYYHTKTKPNFEYWEANFDEFFEIFMAGEVEYNDYFDHLMSWYSHRKDEQIFFTTYERMKEDHKGVVLDLAKFLGQEYVQAIEYDNAVLNNILRFSGFEYMKQIIGPAIELNEPIEDILKNPNISSGRKHMKLFSHNMNAPKDLHKSMFIRKGEMGDWKNHLTPEQSERLNNKFIERLKGTEIQDMYKYYL